MTVCGRIRGYERRGGHARHAWRPLCPKAYSTSYSSQHVTRLGTDTMADPSLIDATCLGEMYCLRVAVYSAVSCWECPSRVGLPLFASEAIPVCDVLSAGLRPSPVHPLHRSPTAPHIVRRPIRTRVAQKRTFPNPDRYDRRDTERRGLSPCLAP